MVPHYDIHRGHTLGRSSEPFSGHGLRFVEVCPEQGHRLTPARPSRHLPERHAHGERSVKTSELLDIMASAEGRQTIPSTPEKLAASELEKIFPMVLRKQGHMNGDVMVALLDHEIDAEEREHIHEHAAEMRRYYQDIEERTAAEKAEVPA